MSIFIFFSELLATYEFYDFLHILSKEEAEIARSLHTFDLDAVKNFLGLYRIEKVSFDALKPALGELATENKLDLRLALRRLIAAAEAELAKLGPKDAKKDVVSSRLASLR